MTATPETTVTTSTGDTQHHFLAGLAEQGHYAFSFAKAGRLEEALEHLDAIERLLVAYRTAVGAPAPEGQGALHRAHVALAEQAGRDQATLRRIREFCAPGQNTNRLGHLRRAKDIVEILDAGSGSADGGAV